MSRTLRIGLNIFSVDPYWIETSEAIYKRAQQTGVELIPVYTNNYLHILQPQPDDEREETALVEEALKLDLDAIIGWNFSGHLALHLLETGVAIIAHGNEVPLEHPLLVGREGLNAAAQMLGNYIVERLGERGHVLVVGGMMLNTQVGDGRHRIAGFRDVFERYPQLHWTHLRASWNYEASYSQICEALEECPESFDAILGLSDSLALAGREAARALNRLGPQTLIGGINGDAQALAAIAEGSFAATVETSATDLGQQMFDLAYQAAQGVPLPKSFTYKRMRLVTSQNVTEVAAQKLMDIASLPNRMVIIRRYEEQQRRTQAALKQSNAELEQFAYIASHDLQEPLRMITSYMGLLSRRYQGQLDAKADQYIGFAVDGATRMQQLINDLLAFSRVGSRGREFSTTDCQTALDHALRNLSVAVTESQAQITHDPLPTIVADGTQLEQLFQNLIGNAIKFRAECAPQVHVSAHQHGAQWLFSVQDNGIGIEPEFAEEVFGIFKRLHTRSEYPGTGLGLAICKKIVERHGGRIWLDSEPGKGTTFYFSLPVESNN